MVWFWYFLDVCFLDLPASWCCFLHSILGSEFEFLSGWCATIQRCELCRPGSNLLWNIPYGFTRTKCVLQLNCKGHSSITLQSNDLTEGGTPKRLVQNWNKLNWHCSKTQSSRQFCRVSGVLWGNHKMTFASDIFAPESSMNVFLCLPVCVCKITFWQGNLYERFPFDVTQRTVILHEHFGKTGQREMLDVCKKLFWKPVPFLFCFRLSFCVPFRWEK